MDRLMTKVMTDRLFATMKVKGISSSYLCKILGCGYRDFEVTIIQGKHHVYTKWINKICETLGEDKKVLFKEFY